MSEPVLPGTASRYRCMSKVSTFVHHGASKSNNVQEKRYLRKTLDVLLPFLPKVGVVDRPVATLELRGVGDSGNVPD